MLDAQKVIKLLVFDLLGYFAFFRKIFTTTSSLSYRFPPRTTIVGLIAGILGYDRDSYYPTFSSEKCKIGLQIKTPVRCIMQGINYLDTDWGPKSGWRTKLTSLMGKKQRVPIHSELLVADRQLPSMLCYRVFLHHEDEKLMMELDERLHRRKFYYPISLGSAYNLANVRYVGLTHAEVFRPNESIEISTVIPIRAIIGEFEPREDIRIYFEERVPADFSPNRLLSRIENYAFEASGKPIKVRVNCDIFKCTVEDEMVLGTFM